MKLLLIYAAALLTFTFVFSEGAGASESVLKIAEWRKTIKHPARKNNLVHTLDLYNGPASGCNPEPMTDVDRKLVVKIHNDLRRTVAKGDEKRGRSGPQPSANNMLKVEYDINLERVAMVWAAQCKSGHDALRDIDGYRFVGQNMLTEASTLPLKKLNWEKQIRANWYNEVKEFNGRDAVTRYTGRNPMAKPGKMVGHYAQLVNAKTRRVGCAQAIFENRSSKTRVWYTRKVACNYGEGIIVNTTLYTEGKPCSDVNKRKCDNGLVVV